MKVNGYAVMAQVLAEIMAVGSIKAGDSVDLPPIHVKSGTTTVQVEITISEDAPKAK